METFWIGGLEKLRMFTVFKGNRDRAQIPCLSAKLLKSRLVEPGFFIYSEIYIRGIKRVLFYTQWFSIKFYQLYGISVFLRKSSFHFQNILLFFLATLIISSEFPIRVNRYYSNEKHI